MSMRWLALVLVVGVLGLGFAAWWSERSKPVATAEGGAANAPEAGAPSVMPPDAAPPGGAPAGPGLRWKVPSGWSAQPERPMRFATYSIPAAGGDARGAECAVFYFGPGQGGDVNANLDRWVGQFDQPQVGTRGTREVHGMKVTRVEVRGTYLAPSGPRMESQGHLDKYVLLGAIAEGPQGNVFFKFTGPQSTVAAERARFDAMIASIEKE